MKDKQFMWVSAKQDPLRQGTYISTVIAIHQTQRTLSIILDAWGWIQFWTIFSTPISTLEPKRQPVKIGNTMSDFQEGKWKNPLWLT